MLKKVIVFILTFVLLISCFVVNSFALTWQDNPDMADGYLYSTPLNFNFNLPGTMTISCSSPYVEFWDYAFFDGAPIQWISYLSDEFKSGVSTNWISQCTNDLLTNGVQWSDVSPRAYRSELVAYPYLLFDSGDIPYIETDEEFDSVDYVRIRFEQSIRLYNTLYDEFVQYISHDEYIDIPASQFSLDLVQEPAYSTGFIYAVEELASSMESALYDKLYSMGYSQEYLNSVNLSDYIAYDNYQCVMSMAYVGVVGGVDTVSYGAFYVGDGVKFVIPAVDFNIQYETQPIFLNLPYADAFTDNFDHSRWFSWIGTALGGFMNAPLFRFGTLNVTIGLLFFSIIAIFGLFFVFRAFAGG